MHLISANNQETLGKSPARTPYSTVNPRSHMMVHSEWFMVSSHGFSVPVAFSRWVRGYNAATHGVGTINHQLPS